MKFTHLFAGLATVACAVGLPTGKAHATQILVGQCLEFSACWDGPDVPWSDILTLSQLESLGLGTDQALVATQTSEFTVRLGVTTADFTVSGGPDVIETLGEYSGNSHSDPGPYDPPTVVGDFTIPADATGLTISGTFGNSIIDSTAGVNVCLGSGSCAGTSTIPEASTWAMMLLGFAGLGFVSYRKTRKAISIAV